MNFKEFVDTECITPDFPIKGVNFLDIFPLLRATKLEDFREKFGSSISEQIIFVPEARGFLFMDALGMDRCIPIRKEGKLPGELISFESVKEYGKDTLFFQKKALESLVACDSDNKCHNVCFVDDVLATGGTAKSFIDFIESLNLNGHTFKVTKCCFYIELTALNGRTNIETEVQSVYQYE